MSIDQGKWYLASWQEKSMKQQVKYKNSHELGDVLEKLGQLPPLVTHDEINHLKKQLAKVAMGEAFLLQGGDCAESFMDCRAPIIQNKMKIILQMSLVLIHALGKPVIRIGRMAGQYAKPRSADVETRGDISLPSYRGDLFNASGFTASEREPDPKRLLDAYCYSALTLNYVRALTRGGFAGLTHLQEWDLGFAQDSPGIERYHQIAQNVRDSLRFLKTIPGADAAFLEGVEFYTSHEALHLLYEQALTRQVETGQWYNLGTHFPWVGLRTADLDGAHLEYLRGLSNPIAVKVGANSSASDIQNLVSRLNPLNEAGRLTLIHRFGAADIKKYLPNLIRAVQETGIAVIWSCDPMHGNTSTTPQGFKTRDFDQILSELRQAIDIHAQEQSYLGGVHFEMTGENVTECIGGARGLDENDLARAYTSLCDPRLNAEQALEMALLWV